MKLKKYVTTQGERAFDWNKFLSKESFTIKSLAKATELSNSWVTCACSNQCAIIPRVGFGKAEPLDDALRYYGGRFFNHVSSMYDQYPKGNWRSERRKAISILHKIEKRSAVLIKQELKKLQS